MYIIYIQLLLHYYIITLLHYNEFSEHTMFKFDYFVVNTWYFKRFRNI
jgi:hypothetical protein